MYKEGIVFMDYRTILQEENDAVRERLDLSMERDSHGRRGYPAALRQLF